MQRRVRTLDVQLLPFYRPYVVFFFDFINESDSLEGDLCRRMAGVVNNSETPDNELNKTRSFWIQGRSGPHWQNLENIAESQAAILRLGELVSQDRYDELKLLESRFSPITGETDYLHVVTIRDKQVIEQPDHGAPVDKPVGDQIVIPENQMILWADEGDSEAQRDFWQIDKPPSGDQQQNEHLSAEDEPFLNHHGRKENATIQDTAPEQASEKTEKPVNDVTSLLAGLSERRSRENTDGTAPPRRNRSQPRNTPINRGVLLSGALAGAFAVGLVIAAINPQSATSIIEAMLDRTPSQETQSTISIDLAAAVVGNNPQVVRQALIAGADPNQRNADGIPVLLAAARDGLPLTVDLLLQAGADPSAPVADGRSVLHFMASEGHGESVRLVLGTGADPDLAGGPVGCLTPLGLAAANGHVRTALVLADYDASLDPMPGCEAGPIELAAAYPVVQSRLESIAAARRSVLASDATIAQEPSVTVPLPTTLDVPAPKAQAALPTPVAVDVPKGTETTVSEPDIPIIIGNIAPESALIPEPVDLASLAPQSTLEVAALTAAPSNFDAPRAPNRPSIQSTDTDPGAASPITSDIRFDSELARVIRDEGVHDLERLLEIQDSPIELASLQIPVSENGALSYKNPIEYAVLNGKLGHAQALFNAGGLANEALLHDVIDRQNKGQHHPALHFLLKNETDTNSLYEGITPLMRAARNNDDRTITLLLAYGADPRTFSDSGQKAADFAADIGAIDVQEKLVIAEAAETYDSLMFGFSWYDTLEKIKPQAEACKSVSDGFVACKLSVPSWLDDTSAVIAQFDTHNGDRLVAIQIDSKLYSNELEARKMFDNAVNKIDSLVPAGQSGFAIQELAKGIPFFESLRPTVNASNFYHYWPDEDRSKPVYLHLKMIGHTTRKGFHRLILGNPFRIG